MLTELNYRYLTYHQRLVFAMGGLWFVPVSARVGDKLDYLLNLKAITNFLIFRIIPIFIKVRKTILGSWLYPRPKIPTANTLFYGKLAIPMV